MAAMYDNDNDCVLLLMSAVAGRSQTMSYDNT